MLVKSFSPKGAKIAFIGEAPGEKEEQLGTPFVGSSGEELRQMLSEVGINFGQCFRGVAIPVRPSDNKIESFFCAKKDLPPDYNYPQIQHNKYLHPDYIPYILQIRQEMLELKPNVIVTLGNTALWAFTGLFGITKHRGVVFDTSYGKVLPTLHPSAVLRKWNDRPIVIADFEKAKYESTFPEVRRPERHLLIEPTIDDVFIFDKQFLRDTNLRSFDIETKGGQITCIAISPSPNRAICIPLYDKTKPDGSYWSFEEEKIVWRWVRAVLTEPGKTRLAQNGLYDIQYLARQGIFITSLEEDTMLLHHAMYPELKKGLGFLASVYTNELSWKGMAKDLGKDK